ncbi:MAG: hypothetical protein ACW98J_09465 [Candidatus Thorarchaeota archaeon]|jgi:hypothetical protein
MGYRRRVTTIGAALDSLVLVLEIASIATIIVLGFAVWKGILSGNLKKSTIWKRPLLVPSLVFTITIIVAMTSIPTPISAYQGTNQVQDDFDLSTTFRVHEAVAYEAEIQVRVTRGLEPNQHVEVFANFSQDGVLIESLFINVTEDVFDQFGGVTRSVVVEPGLYTVTVNNTLYEDDIPQGQDYIHILVNQPVLSSFIHELTTWSSLQFLIGICCFILFLGGVCIRKGDDRRRRESRESPKDREIYLESRLGW